MTIFTGGKRRSPSKVVPAIHLFGDHERSAVLVDSRISVADSRENGMPETAVAGQFSSFCAPDFWPFSVGRTSPVEQSSHEKITWYWGFSCAFL